MAASSAAQAMLMAEPFHVHSDTLDFYRSSTDIIQSILTVGLSDDTHPVVIRYLDHIGSQLGASPKSMEMVRAAVCMHGSTHLRRLGLMVGIKPVDTARLLADCSGGVAWLTWQAALLETYSYEDIAWFQQEAGRLVGSQTLVAPHMRELVSALKATAPRLGTVSFPEHYAKICGAMRQALFAAAEKCPPLVAEPPLIADVSSLLVAVASAYREQRPVIIRGQQSIGWLASILSWIYGEAVEILSAGQIILEAEMRSNKRGLPPLIAVELCEDDDSSMLVLQYVVDKDVLVEDMVSPLSGQSGGDSLTSFGPKRSRADEYFTNWLNCTSPVSEAEVGPLATAASQFTCGLLRTIHVTNEGGEGGTTPAATARPGMKKKGTGLKTETQGAGKQLVNVLKLPGAYSDVRRIQDFFNVGRDAASVSIPPLKFAPSSSTTSTTGESKPSHQENNHDNGNPTTTTNSKTETEASKPCNPFSTPTSQLQLILQANSSSNPSPVKEGGSTTALSFLANVPSLREAYGRMIREMLRLSIRGANDCVCVIPGSGPEAYLPSAHEPHCGVYAAASLAVELVAACICSLFVEGPTSPRLTMFHASPLRWAISKAIEQSVLTGSALISGADMMKSVLVIAGYEGDYGYGPLIISTGGQALVLAALDGMDFNPVSIGRVLALPGAILHRGQYYDRLVVGPCRRPGGDSLDVVRRGIPGTEDSDDTRGGSGGVFYRRRSSLGTALFNGSTFPQPKEAPDMKTKNSGPNAGREQESPVVVAASDAGAADKIEISILETADELQLVVRSQRRGGRGEGLIIKEHDIWHCITAALTANVLGNCSHETKKGFTPRYGEAITLVSSSTNMDRQGVMNDGLTVAAVKGRPFDRLLACGVGVNMVVQTSGCLECAVSACRQLRYWYIIT